MNDVAAWLDELGLAKYARAFQEHEIDVSALPHLTEHMLAEIGLPIGPRAKVLAAIAGLGARAAQAPATGYRVQGEDAVARSGPPGRQPERRQLTVLLCDLADSTKLASSLDPEDFKSLMQAYQAACGTVVRRYDGHVGQYRGDAIEVYFGWPAALEDAAERAVRAGLEIVQAVAAVSSPQPLAVRVGISTGIVVIGETGLGDPATPSGAVGDTPHIAARLQTLAQRGAVVIAESTSRLLSARFECEDLGLQDLKGIAGRVRAFSVRGVREDSSRFQAAHTAQLTPFVGRGSELALLRQRWRDAKEGDGQVVYLSGVPGIGKSRICHELEKGIGAEPHFHLRYQCLPHHMQSPFFPVIQQLRRLADLGDGDSAEHKLDRLRETLALATENPDGVVPYAAELLSIPLAPRYPPFRLSASQLKVQILFALVDLLVALSRKAPVFCLFEDVQWIDPSTQELLDLAVDQVGRARVLLVVTHRPEVQPRAGARGNVSALSIARLGRRDAAEMAQLVLRGKTVAPAVLSRVIDESDAIPLFVEELGRGVVGSGTSPAAAGPDRIADPAASWSVPDSLRDSLMARLDRAPQARSVAQTAAVIGREFSYQTLLHASALSAAELDAALELLQQSEIIQQVDSQRSARFAFNHALVRDAAYESLLKSSRRDIHARVGAAIERAWPETVGAQPELLAYHYGLAGHAEEAVRYWVLGGQRARSRSANVEALEQFQKALEFLEQLPDTPARRERELEIQLSLGLCSIAARGYSADDTRSSFERACSLSAQLGQPHREIQSIFGLWGHHWMRAQHDRAMALADMLLAKSEMLAEPIGQVVGHRSLGSTLFTLGEFERAREHLEQAIALAREGDGKGLSLTYAVDPRIAAELVLAWDLWILGYPARALATVEDATALAGERGDPYSVAFAHYVASAVRLLRREPRESREHAEKSLALSTEHRINLYALYSRFGRGCALAMLGQAQDGIVDIRAGIEEARRSGLRYMHGFMLGWLGTVQGALGEVDAALSTVEDALEQVNDVSGRAWEAELLRLRGDAVLAAHPNALAEAEGNYRAALSTARRQAARALELRAATSLARVLQRLDKADEARSALAAAYAWFSEGFDTADLRDARALLDELG